MRQVARIELPSTRAEMTLARLSAESLFIMTIMLERSINVNSVSVNLEPETAALPHKSARKCVRLVVSPAGFEPATGAESLKAGGIGGRLSKPERLVRFANGDGLDVGPRGTNPRARTFGEGAGQCLQGLRGQHPFLS